MNAALRSPSPLARAGDVARVERYLVATDLGGRPLNRIWNPDHELELGHPVRLVLSRTDAGVRIVRYAAGGLEVESEREFRLTDEMLKDGFVMRVTDSVTQRPVKLDIRPMNHLTPVHVAEASDTRTAVPGLEQLLCFACIENWVVSTERAGAGYAGHYGGQRIFRLKRVGPGYEFTALVDGVEAMSGDRWISSGARGTRAMLSEAAAAQLFVQFGPASWRLTQVRSPRVVGQADELDAESEWFGRALRAAAVGLITLGALVVVTPPPRPPALPQDVKLDIARPTVVVQPTATPTPTPTPEPTPEPKKPEPPKPKPKPPKPKPEPKKAAPKVIQEKPKPKGPPPKAEEPKPAPKPPEPVKPKGPTPEEIQRKVEAEAKKSAEALAKQQVLQAQQAELAVKKEAARQEALAKQAEQARQAEAVRQEAARVAEIQRQAAAEAARKEEARAKLSKSLGFMSTASSSVGKANVNYDTKPTVAKGTAAAGSLVQGTRTGGALSDMTRKGSGTGSAISTRSSRQMDGSAVDSDAGFAGGKGKGLNKVLGKVVLPGAGGGGSGGDGLESLGDTSLKMEGKGTLSQALLEKTLSKYLDRFQYCYEKALLSDSSLSGNVVLSWEISTAGSASNIHVVRSQLNNSGLHGCLSKEIQKIPFPSPSGGSVTVKYPFNFSSTSL